MEMAGAASLQELLVSAHGHVERVDHLVAVALRRSQDVGVFVVQLLDPSLPRHQAEPRSKTIRRRELWIFDSD